MRARPCASKRASIQGSNARTHTHTHEHAHTRTRTHINTHVREHTHAPYAGAQDAVWLALHQQCPAPTVPCTNSALHQQWPCTNAQDAVWLALHQTDAAPSSPGHYLLAITLTLIMLALSALAALATLTTRVSPYIGARPAPRAPFAQVLRPCSACPRQVGDGHGPPAPGRWRTGKAWVCAQALEVMGSHAPGHACEHSRAPGPLGKARVGLGLPAWPILFDALTAYLRQCATPTRKEPCKEPAHAAPAACTQALLRAPCAMPMGSLEREARKEKTTRATKTLPASSASKGRDDL